MTKMFIIIYIYAVLLSLVTEAVLGVTLEQKDLLMTKEAVLGVTLVQKDLFWTKGEGKTVYISCKVTDLSSSNYVHWYQKKDGEALTRILYVNSGGSLVQDPNHPEAKDFTVRIQSDNYDLKIESLKKIHEAVYYCASWAGLHSNSKYSQHVENYLLLKDSKTKEVDSGLQHDAEEELPATYYQPLTKLRTSGVKPPTPKDERGILLDHVNEVIFLLLNITLWDWVKVFGSGTRLYVTDEKVKKPQLTVYPVFKPKETDGKSVLMCQARDMYPDLVRFTWKAKDLKGQDVNLGDDERLEQTDKTNKTDKDSEVRITSMLIVNNQKAIENKFTCSVQHDSDQQETLSIPTDEDLRENKPDSEACSTQKPEDEKEEEEEIENFGLFELSRKLYLFIVTYVLLLVKNVFYFCIVSVLRCMRNPAPMEMIRGKVR
ncbi:uncharacterized protein LOC113663835 [Tachysurus fulvidraco]|uniref:uncharacterized protein LOC113663835 n=1 Tax=Tachysurus fulvidraco TaxID=1234273 RepID=UPI001FEEDF34|nr:uncharacterized protein LOC113663835 [Tachysurus fulvidraco]